MKPMHESAARAKYVELSISKGKTNLSVGFSFVTYNEKERKVHYNMQVRTNTYMKTLVENVKNI